MGDNGVHASASPFEALAERMEEHIRKTLVTPITRLPNQIRPDQVYLTKVKIDQKISKLSEISKTLKFV